MIQIARHGTPDEAERRLSFFGVPRDGIAALVAELRPYLVRVPRDAADFPAIGRAAAAAGLPFASGDDAGYFSVSSLEHARELERRAPGEAGRAVREALERYLEREFTVRCRDAVLELHGPPRIMGILNVTPDSFSDGDPALRPEDAVRRGVAMAEEGAEIVDVGGESTRPGAAPVPEDEERRRVLPVIRALSREVGVLISIDTTKASVARAAVQAGASIVNDTSALADDPAMASVVRDSGCAVVLMHRRGLPATMQDNPSYRSVMPEILEGLAGRIAAAGEAGIPGDRILVDPGIGFGKRLGDNLAIQRRLDELRNLGKPILLGPSRKSFIGTITGRPPAERAFGTAASVAWAVLAGAHLLRVHDVAAMREVVQVAAAIRDGAEA